MNSEEFSLALTLVLGRLQCYSKSSTKENGNTELQTKTQVSVNSGLTTFLENPLQTHNGHVCTILF